MNQNKKYNNYYNFYNIETSVLYFTCYFGVVVAMGEVFIRRWSCKTDKNTALLIIIPSFTLQWAGFKPGSGPRALCWTPLLQGKKSMMAELELSQHEGKVSTLFGEILRCWWQQLLKMENTNTTQQIQSTFTDNCYTNSINHACTQP